jgi:putative DNA primase/helicase
MHHEDFDFSEEELADAQSEKTDAANADAVVRSYPNTFLYVVEWEMWIIWDGTRWHLPGGKTGAKDQVVHRIIRTARVRYISAKTRLAALEEEAKTVLTAHGKDSAQFEAITLACKSQMGLIKWLEASQNSSRVSGCEMLLRGQLAVHKDTLDAHPWLFNVANGTVDLRTGKLRPHDRTDLLTQMSDIEYDPEAKAPHWERLLATAMAGDESMVLYLQRLIGYTLTGTTQEHMLVFHYGHTGSNGKSTFLAALRNLLGEYGCAAPKNLLFEPKNGADPHPTELARLYGKRLATCSEVPENVELAEAKVKDLTGGDTLSVRRMNENFWDMVPTHTLHLAGNHKPIIRGTDGGIWRRIKLVPWLVQIPEEQRDKGLGEKLRAELPGILNWALEGCRLWQMVGLSEPDAVKSASADYRSESDILGIFFATQCVFEAGARLACKSLRKSYELWCEDLGHLPVGARMLGRRLRERGVTDVTVRLEGRPAQGWAGVRTKSAVELSTEARMLEDPHVPPN